METESLKFFLITSLPGTGKTTLVRKICNKLDGVFKLQGFYTEEVRSGTTRIGFDVVSLDGKRNILARHKPDSNMTLPKVGKYTVNINNFEALALPILDIANCQPQLMVIDEVGRMELLSTRFEPAIKRLIHQAQPMLITLAQNKSIPLISQLQKDPRARLYHLSKDNRDKLVDEIIEDIVNNILSKDQAQAYRK